MTTKRKSLHGFLSAQPDGKFLLTIEQQQLYGARSDAVEDLTELALFHNLTHLWIMPSYGAMAKQDAEKLTGLHPDAGFYEYTPYVPAGGEHLSSVLARRLKPAETDYIQIIWLEQSAWGLRGSIRELQLTFAQIEHALGVGLRGHPGVTGLTFLRKIDAEHYYRYFQLPRGVQWDMIRAVSVSSLHEFPQATEGALAGAEYLYCYDRNSSHPYSASQLKCGIGRPQIFGSIEFDHLAPGFWCIEIEGLEQLWNGLPLLPAEREWLPTPLVKMLQQRGCKIRVNEAYIWPSKSDRAPVFHRWAHALWELREKYPPGSQERQAVKSIMNTSIGLLRRKNGEGHSDYRPDWYSLILAEERAVVWYKAWQVWQATGQAPIGAYHDALYYVGGNEPLSLLTHHKDGRSLEHSLGGYKIDWRLPLNTEVKALLLAPQPRSAADRISTLKRYGREHGYIS